MIEEDSAKYLEKEVLAHRFLYYVMASPIISDFEYDLLDKEATAVCPPESPIHQVGSSLPSSYSEEVKSYAMKLIQNA